MKTGKHGDCCKFLKKLKLSRVKFIRKRDKEKREGKKESACGLLCGSMIESWPSKCAVVGWGGRWGSVLRGQDGKGN